MSAGIQRAIGARRFHGRKSVAQIEAGRIAQAPLAAPLAGEHPRGDPPGVATAPGARHDGREHPGSDPLFRVACFGTVRRQLHQVHRPVPLEPVVAVRDQRPARDPGHENLKQAAGIDGIEPGPVMREAVAAAEPGDRIGKGPRSKAPDPSEVAAGRLGDLETPSQRSFIQDVERT